MTPHWIVAVALVATIWTSVPVAGGRILLRPMSGTEVYRALREVGREDAVPEGRVVTQGLSALTGFGLGLASGVGGSLLVNLATAGLNTTALTSLLGGSSSNAGAGTVQTQEICFTSRSLNDINDDEEQPDSYVQGKQATAPTNTQTATTGGNTGTVTTGTSPTGTTGSAPGTTGSTSPTTTNTNTGTNTGTNVNTGTGTGSNTATTTQTDPPATNCIVIEKPIRRRRSVR